MSLLNTIWMCCSEAATSYWHISGCWCQFNLYFPGLFQPSTSLYLNVEHVMHQLTHTYVHICHTITVNVPVSVNILVSSLKHTIFINCLRKVLYGGDRPNLTYVSLRPSAGVSPGSCHIITGSRRRTEWTRRAEDPLFDLRLAVSVPSTALVWWCWSVASAPRVFAAARPRL